jgi:hypothetical protein
MGTPRGACATTAPRRARRRRAPATRASDEQRHRPAVSFVSPARLSDTHKPNPERARRSIETSRGAGLSGGPTAGRVTARTYRWPFGQVNEGDQRSPALGHGAEDLAPCAALLNCGAVSLRGGGNSEPHSRPGYGFLAQCDSAAKSTLGRSFQAEAAAPVTAARNGSVRLRCVRVGCRAGGTAPPSQSRHPRASAHAVSAPRRCS